MLAKWPETNTDGLLICDVYASKFEDQTALLHGICPNCNFQHQWGISESPLRYPTCAPIFRKPDTIALRFNPGNPPHDVQFAMDNEPEDVLFWSCRVLQSYGARMLALKDAEKVVRRGRMRRDEVQSALLALLNSGPFSERSAIMCESCPENEGAINRSLLAAFIRKQPGHTMRERFGKALGNAARLAARGESV